MKKKENEEKNKKKQVRVSKAMFGMWNSSV
jgi:hypothetical protein